MAGRSRPQKKTVTRSMHAPERAGLETSRGRTMSKRQLERALRC